MSLNLNSEQKSNRHFRAMTSVLEMQCFAKQIGADPARGGGPALDGAALGRKEMLGGSAELVRAGLRFGLGASASNSPPDGSRDNGERSFDWRFDDQLILAGKTLSGASEDISLCWK